MKSSLIILMSICIFTLIDNKSPFYMNLSMILLILSLSSWAIWLANKWIFSVMIIFYLGGMMVLFAYIVSLSKSKHTFFNSNMTKWVALSTLFMWLPHNLTPNPPFFFKSYYLVNWQYMFFLGFMLLVLLIVVNKICMSYFGPIAYKQND